MTAFVRLSRLGVSEENANDADGARTVGWGGNGAEMVGPEPSGGPPAICDQRAALDWDKFAVNSHEQSISGQCGLVSLQDLSVSDNTLCN